MNLLKTNSVRSECSVRLRQLGLVIFALAYLVPPSHAKQPGYDYVAISYSDFEVQDQDFSGPHFELGWLIGERLTTSISLGDFSDSFEFEGISNDIDFKSLDARLSYAITDSIFIDLGVQKSELSYFGLSADTDSISLGLGYYLETDDSYFDLVVAYLDADGEEISDFGEVLREDDNGALISAFYRKYLNEAVEFEAQIAHYELDESSTDASMSLILKSESSLAFAAGLLLGDTQGLFAQLRYEF